MRRWRANNREQVVERERERSRTRRGGSAAQPSWDYSVCYLCEKPLESPTHVDHIHPLARGGQHEPLNLATVHAHCNMSKGSKTPLEIFDGFNH